MPDELMEPFKWNAIVAAYCMYLDTNKKIHSKTFAKVMIKLNNSNMTSLKQAWLDAERAIRIISPQRLGGLAAKKTGDSKRMRRLRKELVAARKINDVNKIEKLIKKIRYEYGTI